jgi:hypothetical protein
MPKRPHHPSRPEIEQEEETQRQFQADAIARQSNVLPLDAARNEERFYGRLICGKRPLSGVERIGYFLVGWIFFGWGILGLMAAFPRVFNFIGLHVTPIGDGPISMYQFAVAVLAVLLGLRVISTAIWLPYRKLPR